MTNGLGISDPGFGHEFLGVVRSSLAEKLAERLKEAWLEEDRTGRIDHEWASRLDPSLTLAVLGEAFDIFSRESPGVIPELDRCNLAERSTRITFRRDYQL